MTKLWKLPKIQVIDSKNQYCETLTCIERDSFEHDIELNQTDQLSFTADDDKSIGYQLLQNENFLLYKGQQYRIKQASHDDSSYNFKREITATHIRFDAQYVFQYNKWSGQRTISPQDILSFVFDQNGIGNNGFTWHVVGTPEKVAVQDYGDKSGQECINDCCTKFNMVVTADNKSITLTTMDLFTKKLNKAFRYIHDTPEFKTSVDTTDLQNITKVFGKTKDGGGDKTQYYFDPFIVRDENSINRWGERAGASLSDERFTDAYSIKQYALKQMKSQPTVSMSLTYDGADDFELGNMVFADIRPENYTTWVTVVGVKTNDLKWFNKQSITLNNLPGSLLDYDLSMQKSIKEVISKIANDDSSITDVSNNNLNMGVITKKVGVVNDGN